MKKIKFITIVLVCVLLMTSGCGKDAKKAKEKNIPVFLTGSGSTAYESASAFEALGITVLPEMSPLAAYVKLWLITDNNLPFDLMRENICGELI